MTVRDTARLVLSAYLVPPVVFACHRVGALPDLESADRFARAYFFAALAIAGANAARLVRRLARRVSS